MKHNQQQVRNLDPKQFFSLAAKTSLHSSLRMRRKQTRRFRAVVRQAAPNLSPRGALLFPVLSKHAPVSAICRHQFPSLVDARFFKLYVYARVGGLCALFQNIVKNKHPLRCAFQLLLQYEARTKLFVGVHWGARTGIVYVML